MFGILWCPKINRPNLTYDFYFICGIVVDLFGGHGCWHGRDCDEFLHGQSPEQDEESL